MPAISQQVALSPAPRRMTADFQEAGRHKKFATAGTPADCFLKSVKFLIYSMRMHII
jgi:hypothetical protein